MSRHLVIQLARFGDLIQTKRLMAELERAPGAEVHLCLDASLEPLARIVFPRVVTHPVLAHGTNARTGLDTLIHNRAAFASLQDQDFDQVLNLNFSGLNFALSALFDPDIVAGYRRVNGQDIKGWWPSMAFRFARNRRLGLNLVDFWAAFHTLSLDPAVINPPATPGGGGLGVVLAGRNARRSLPPKVLSRVISARFERLGRCPVFLLGSQGERKAADELRRELRPAVLEKTSDLTGKTDWQGLADALAGLDEILTPDTGTMHLAAHLGVPVRAFFLSSAWCFETGPYGAGHTVWQSMEECAPCLESRPCDMGVACLEPFSDPGFIRALATDRLDKLPPGLAGFRPRFDGLGLLYEAFAGKDPDTERRNALRSFLAKHLLPQSGWERPPDRNLAQKIYQERDWMTEQHP